MEQAAYCLFETSLGFCGIGWKEFENSKRPPAVILFQLPEATAKLTEVKISQRLSGVKSSTPPPRIAEIIKKIDKHFQGEPQDFRDIEIDLEGVGGFAREIYEAARKIPVGRTSTYGDLAHAVGRPQAARAVGQAMRKNPIALIIPCHRVLGAGGKPGGFSAYGGGTTKARMLEVEGATLGALKAIKTVKDLQRAAGHLRTLDPRLAVCLDQPIKFRLKRGQAPYASLFEAVVHQQLSTKVAGTILNRVKSLYSGTTVPEPEELLATPDSTLREAGLSRSKITALKDLAAKTLDGTVPTAKQIVALSDEEIVERLTSIHGVGTWTVEMLLIFTLGRPDVFPVDDYALRKIIAEVCGLGEIPTAKQLKALLGDAWRPHRSVAAIYLWNYINTKNGLS